jgi:hypothetical protein
MNEIYFNQLREMAAAINDGTPPNLGPDALIYAGSATWDRWENHVPVGLRSMWPLLGEESRLAVFLTAKAFTAYGAN